MKTMNTRTEPQDNKLTLSSLKEMMEDSYQLAYVHYNDDLDEQLDLIQQCLEDRSSLPLEESCMEWFLDSRETSVEDICNELLKRCADIYGQKEAYAFFSDNDDLIRDEIRERDSSDEIKDLLRNTSAIPVRIEMITDNDCYGSAYNESRHAQKYWDSYLGDIADALRLNPAKLEEEMQKRDMKTIGRFPDRKYRNGREKVAYTDLLDELEGTTCGANLLTFITRLDPLELYNAGFDITRVTIPEGGLCGLYSSLYGGGGYIEMPLTRKIRLRTDERKNGRIRYRITVDGKRRGEGEYTIYNCYGITSDYFGNTAKINA